MKVENFLPKLATLTGSFGRGSSSSAMMPVMDGPTFYQELRKIKTFAETPVILFSAVAEKLVLPGLAGQLKKPADLEELLVYVNRYCQLE